MKKLLFLAVIIIVAVTCASCKRNIEIIGVGSLECNAAEENCYVVIENVPYEVNTVIIPFKSPERICLKENMVVLQGAKVTCFTTRNNNEFHVVLGEQDEEGITSIFYKNWIFIFVAILMFSGLVYGIIDWVRKH